MAPFVAADWGTSRLRAFLVTAGGVEGPRLGPGAAQARGAHEQVVLDLIAPWRARHGALPLLLCGMAGANLGWREAPYLDCPAAPEAIAAALLRFEARGHAVAIAPGLACRNPAGAPDVLRGEETQILGAMAEAPELRQGRRLLCLPGTHSKWAQLADGAVETFLTGATGEVFALLRRDSVLLRGAAGAAAHDPAAFALGLERTGPAGAGLLAALFEARSRQLREGLSAEAAVSFVSGLLIGADVAHALAVFAHPGEVSVIGAPELTAGYAAALARAGVGVRLLEGEAMALAGLLALHRLQQREAEHAEAL